MLSCLPFMPARFCLFLTEGGAEGFGGEVLELLAAEGGGGLDLAEEGVGEIDGRSHGSS